MSTDGAKFDNDETRNIWAYEQVNICADLSSEDLESVPSLRLTDEVFEDIKYFVVDDSNHYQEDIPKPSRFDQLTESQQRQASPDFYSFTDIDVTLYGIGNSLYNNHFRFQKCNLHFSYEGCVKICLLSRCTKPVAYKFLCNKSDFTTAAPNMGVLRYGIEERLMLFLKEWSEDEAKNLVYRIQIARIDDGMDVTNVWHNPKAVICSTSRLRCMLIDENETNSRTEREIEYEEENQVESQSEPKSIIKTTKFRPRPTYMPRWTQEKKHRRFGVMRKLFRRIFKLWRRVRGRSKKEGKYNDDLQHNNNKVYSFKTNII